MTKDYFQCPLCHSPLRQSEDGHSLYCTGPRAHCFDFSSSGYVNLAVRHPGGGDSGEAVRARSAFLRRGYYAPILQALAQTLGELDARDLVVDAGCGEGYYTGELAKLCPAEFVGFDLSKFAIDAAAKAARRERIENVHYAVAKIHEMPLPSGCACVILNIFAPCAQEEFSRVLRPGGRLILAGAAPDHLLELKAALYEKVYKNDTRADLPSNMTLEERRRVRFSIELDNADDIRSLFSMTPYYYRTGTDGFARLETLQTLRTGVDVDLFVYRKQ